MSAIKQQAYYEFARFMATPKFLREEIKTQKQFMEVYNVSHDTLARWKKDLNFQADVDRAVKNWGSDVSTEVLGALYIRCTQKADPKAIRLWLQLFDGLKVSADESDKKETLTDILKREWLELKKEKAQTEPVSESWHLSPTSRFLVNYRHI